MKIRLPPIGFWSYARLDDELSRGMLSRLRSLLMSELQQTYGKSAIQIFQDVAAIPVGDEWERAIVDALSRSTFLIAIITPSFIQSEYCCREISLFLEREKELLALYPDTPIGTRRIFPILYIDIADTEPHDPSVLEELRKLQWFDFTARRYADYESQEVREDLERLARPMRSLLYIPFQAPPTPEEQALLDAAEAEQRAQMEITRQQAEAVERRRQERMKAEEAGRLQDIADLKRKAAEHEAEQQRMATEQAAEAERIEAERAASERQREEERAYQERQAAAELAKAREKAELQKQQEAERREEALREAAKAAAEKARRRAQASDETGERAALPIPQAALRKWWPALTIGAIAVTGSIFFALKPGATTMPPTPVAPVPPVDWISGTWGIDGDCSMTVTASIAGDSLVLTQKMPGMAPAESRQHISARAADYLLTDAARYDRERQGDGVIRINVDVKNADLVDYSLADCPGAQSK